MRFVFEIRSDILTICSSPISYCCLGKSTPIQDGFGMSFQSSQSPLGPPFSVLNLQDSHLLSIHEQSVEIELRIWFFWYGEEYESVWVDKECQSFIWGIIHRNSLPICVLRKTRQQIHHWLLLIMIGNPIQISLRLDIWSISSSCFAVEWSGTYQDATGESSGGTVQYGFAKERMVH